MQFWLQSLQSFMIAVMFWHVFICFCFSNANPITQKYSFSAPQICWLAQFVWWVNNFAQNIRWLNYKQGIWLCVYFIKLLLPNFFLLPHPHRDSWKDLPLRGCPCLQDGGESLRVTEMQPTGSLDSCYYTAAAESLIFALVKHIMGTLKKGINESNREPCI